MTCHKRRWLLVINGLLLLPYGVFSVVLFLSGKVLFLVHQDYVLFVGIAGFILFIFALTEFFQLKTAKASCSCVHLFPGIFEEKKIDLFLLLLPFLLLFLYQMKPLSSSWNSASADMANQIVYSRNADEIPRFVLDTQKRSLTDWLRLFDQNPDPSTYKGLKVKITGFVAHNSSWDDNFFQISRYVISCCAADARIVGIPVYVDSSKISLPQEDQWITLEGVLGEMVLNGEHQPVIFLEHFIFTQPPDNPYES